MIPAARRAASRVAGWLRDLADALLPPSCPACRTPLDPGRDAGLLGLCDACRATVLLAPAGCPCCGDPGTGTAGPCDACRGEPPAFGRLRAALLYGGAARDLLLAFKHGRAFALAGPLGTLAAATALREGLLAGAGLVVPVPGWPGRVTARGYSPPALLARVVARRAGLPFAPACLQRVSAPGEARAGREARLRQVRGAFRVRRPADVAGRAVLVVDDVAATGATAREAARALREAGASRVCVVAVARAG